MLNANQGPSRDHEYFVGCSGCVRGFTQGHQSHSIPDNVGEQMLAKSLADQPLSDDSEKDTQPCSKLVHPNLGLRQQFCPHAHIVEGKAVRSRIEQTECFAKRNIYVPIDTSIRKALIITNGTGHNHPMPPLAKPTLGGKGVWKTCVKASGIVGATVAKVDNATSTTLILGGKTPLYSKRVKGGVIRGMKSKQFPHGWDETGLFHIYLNHLTKPLPERYIHGYITTDGGGIGALTCVPYLLKLLDDPGVISFDGDTTYKRVDGKMNGWELTIFAKIALRSASVVRAYINRGSTDFFELLFDELQRVKLMATGKPMPLKRFVKGGNIHVMNSDMDGAQVLGICRSVMKHNDPEYSGIPSDTPPEQVASEFVKICWRHAKEPVHDFRSLVPETDHARLRDFVYIDSNEKLDDFSAFVVDWWAHKQMHPWIIPCLVRSQSRIPNGIWDITPSTTNTNEAQHAWTNPLTGIGLSLFEAVETAHKLDRKVSSRILTTNSLSALPAILLASQQGHEMRVIEAEKRRESNAFSRNLKERLQAVKGKGGPSGRGTSTPLLSASSSGRVKSAPIKATSRKRSEQSNVIPPPSTADAQSPPLPMLSTNLPGVGTALVDQPDAAIAPEFYVPHQVTQPMVDSSANTTFDFSRPDLNSARNNADVSSLDDQQFPRTLPFNPSFDAQYDFNLLSPPIMAADPLQDLINVFGIYSTPFDDSFWLSSTPSSEDSSSSPFSFPTAHPGNEEQPSFSIATAVGVDSWPILPPPHPDSPPSPPMTDVSSAATAAKARSHREPEVDVRNILPETSARSRAPTARKRNAEEAIEVRKPKKVKKSATLGDENLTLGKLGRGRGSAYRPPERSEVRTTFLPPSPPHDAPPPLCAILSNTWSLFVYLSCLATAAFAYISVFIFSLAFPTSGPIDYRSLHVDGSQRTMSTEVTTMESFANMFC
ncbi:hypothetical protein B0H13DRAFT_2451468 [Mycena leptocephala]|nr:hypothetical protein B0H13DRAFT_2451468 [Mycena leptocephala]